MKYLKSYKIYESLTRKAVIQFSEDYGNLLIRCELDEMGLIVANEPEIRSYDIMSVDDDAMEETFSPLRKFGINIKYQGWESILQDEEYGGGYMEDIDGYFKVNVNELNNAIKSGKIKLEPESDNPNEEYFNLKIVG